MRRKDSQSGLMQNKPPRLHYNPEWFVHSAHLPTGVYGSAWAHHLARIPQRVAEVIGNIIVRLPTNPATMLSVHKLRCPSADVEHRHSLCYCLCDPRTALDAWNTGIATVESAREETEAWATQMAAKIEGVLPAAYIPLYNARRGGQLDKVLAKAEGVRAPKARFDPGQRYRLLSEPPGSPRSSFKQLTERALVPILSS
ncbi:hypothetical protein BJY00DRAFT_310355 [Aspergillus carlsbadensis]|nr:hypothetical protein BJY00DRAFT_310355 [Aspergillus carlsbadensis]